MTNHKEVAMDSASTLGEAIASRLHAAGIDTVFGIPGTHVIELYRGFDRSGIRAVTPRHEQGVGFAATAWGLVSGLPGIAVTTSGPGLLNVLAAAGTAYCESRSLIILSPGTPTDTPPERVGILHETKDSVSAAGAVVKWSARATSPEHALRLVGEALDSAAGRPGPKHIEIPTDLLAATVSAEERSTAVPVQENPQQEVRSTSLDDAARVIAAAARPCILAGGGSTGASDAVRRLAERLGAPVVSTINGKGVLDEEHPLALGSELRLGTVHQYLEDADVVLIVGSRLAEAEFWSGPFQPRGQVIRVDIDAEQIHVNVSADVTLLGDAEEILGALVDRLGSEQIGQQPPLESLREQMRTEQQSEGGEALELARRLVEWIPRDAIVSMDSSQICYLGMNSVLQPSRPDRIIQAATYSPLGMALPGAIGAAIAEPGRKTWCVTGDGALMFSIQELLTAAEEDLDVTVIVVDNGGYREIAENMVDAGIRPQGVDLQQPDWSGLARALGAQAMHLDASAPADEFARAGRFAAEAGLRMVHLRQGPREQVASH